MDAIEDGTRFPVCLAAEYTSCAPLSIPMCLISNVRVTVRNVTQWRNDHGPAKEIINWFSWNWSYGRWLTHLQLLRFALVRESIPTLARTLTYVGNFYVF